MGWAFLIDGLVHVLTLGFVSCSLSVRCMGAMFRARRKAMGNPSEFVAFNMGGARIG